MKQTLETFGSIALSRKILQAVEAMGFEEPSPIQARTIPLALEGHDVIGQAQTGTGKTAAFGIPVVKMVKGKEHGIQALVLTPTRELAIQTAEELNKIGRFKHVRTLPVYGGQSVDRQIRALKRGVHIVVSTPGRLLDHIHRGTIDLQRVRTLVLDEADEMLDMGFIDDIEHILSNIPEQRQTLLFSATMPEPIEKLSHRYMEHPERVTITRENLTVPSIEQVYYETRQKFEGLCRVLDVEETGKLIIFCRTKRAVDDLTAALDARGYSSGGLHGDLSQIQRDRVMKRFREGRIDILIATDVAARGIDIDDITHVINFDIPQDHESYVHRIGRTGRAGRKGMAITFIEPREYRQLRLIMKLAHTRIQRRELPTASDILERQREVIRERLVRTLRQNRYDEYHDIVSDAAAEGFDPVDIAAAALKLSIEGFRNEESHDEADGFGDTGGAPGMVRLFFNVGRSQKIRPSDIVRAIAGEADIPGDTIGVINIYDKFTFVEVPEDTASRVMNAMHRNTVKGFRVNVEPARKR